MVVVVVVMGGGAPCRGGSVVRAGESISGSVSSKHKIINIVFIAELLSRLSLDLSPRSQQ